MTPARTACFFVLFLLAGVSLPAHADPAAAARIEAGCPSLSDHFSAQHYEFEWIDEFYKKKLKAGEPFSFDLRFDWAADRKLKAELLLYSLVCGRHYGKSSAARLRLFREYSAWRTYFCEERPSNAHYIAPWNSWMGLMIDAQRLCTRYDAFSLLMESSLRYQQYSELANKGEVRLPGRDKPVRLWYGEVSTERKTARDESYYDFHAELVPATCIKYGSVYIGCLRTFESPDGQLVGYCFCVWGGDGTLQALHVMDIPAEKRNKQAVETNAHGEVLSVNAANGVYGETLEVSISAVDLAEVTLLVNGQPVWSGGYLLEDRNQNSLSFQP